MFYKGPDSSVQLQRKIISFWFILNKEPAMWSQRGKKRQLVEIEKASDADRVYRFRVLLPNGVTIGLSIRDPAQLRLPLKHFIGLVEEEYLRAERLSKSTKQRRPINWKAQGMSLEDAYGVEMKFAVNLDRFKPHKCHILQLYVSVKRLFYIREL